MRNQVKVARPTARKDAGGSSTKMKKTMAVASTRKSAPIIQLVERKSSPAISGVTKKVGELPTPIATFTL